MAKGTAISYLIAEDFDKAGPFLLDTFQARHPEDLSAATGPGWSGKKGSPRIDYVFAEELPSSGSSSSISRTRRQALRP